MAGGTDGEILTYDASGNPVAVSVGTDGQVLTSTGAGSPPAFEAAAAGGKLLQVVSTTKTDTFTSSSTSWTDITGLSATITPSSTSSKILISVTTSGSVNAGGNIFFALARGGSQIALGDTSGSRTRCTTHWWVYDSVYYQHLSTSVTATNLDSPATTSAVTYSMQLIAQSGVTGYVNRSANDSNSVTKGRGSSTITVMEIGA
jgi:hypothetical protein